MKLTLLAQMGPLGWLALAAVALAGGVELLLWLGRKLSKGDYE